MEFYRISQNRNIRNSIQLEALPCTNQKSKGPVFIRGTVQNTGDYVFFPPIIEHTKLVISDEVKVIWESMQAGWRYEPCVIGNVEQKIVRVYWIAEAKYVAALSDQTEYQKDGTFKKIVLKEDEVRYQKVFAIRNRKKTYYVVEKAVAEKMLEQHIHGFILQKLETDGGGEHG